MAYLSYYTKFVMAFLDTIYPITRSLPMIHPDQKAIVKIAVSLNDIVKFFLVPA